MRYQRPQHATIVRMLHAMDAELLAATRCFFGGGTAVVLQHGEYRLSRDVDFLCADTQGYREIRAIARGTGGVAALFGGKVSLSREPRIDQYGIRAVLLFEGEPIKFEVVREARIPLEGELDEELHVPTLSAVSQFAEKLLANSDRGLDKAAAYRDAIDLGRLVMSHGDIPAAAIALAEQAYGEDIARSVQKVLAQLTQEDAVAMATAAMDMRPGDVTEATLALSQAARRAWPVLTFPERDERSVVI